jgi:hypothetical protein
VVRAPDGAIKGAITLETVSRLLSTKTDEVAA